MTKKQETKNKQIPNSKSQYSKRLVIVSCILVSFFFLPFFTQAALVPCGNKGQPDCTLCDLFVLIKKIMDFATLIAIPLAVGFMAYGGIRMAAAGGSEEGLKKGKGAITNALIGIFLVFGAWLIIDLILGNLLAPGFLPWSKFPQCQQALSAGRQGQSSQTSSGIISGASLTPVTLGEGASLRPFNSSASSGTYNQQIENYLKGANLNGIDSNRVRAIIQSESSGKPSVVSTDTDGKQSYGLMQIRLDTALLYNPSLKSLSDNQVAELLKNPQYNINIGTKYYADLLNKYKDPVLAHAAYNGGPVANNPSVNCPGLRRWQCLWDESGCYNTSKTDCLQNERTDHPGYGPTRRYIENIDKVYSSLVSKTQ